MSCDCQNYLPIPLDRKSVSTRIKESKALKKRLQVVAEDTSLGIALFRCPSCEEMWQSGREWNFENAEYLFRVPNITIEDWQTEHYRQPAAMMIYSAVMESYYSRSKFAPAKEKCSIDGCEERASALGILCRKHQIESLQANRQLPKPPAGRIFPPYYDAEKKNGA